MPTPEIIERVRKLHGDLATTPPAAPAAEHVVSLRSDLDDVIAAPHEKHRYTSLNDRLREAAANLRAHHPKLAGAVQGLIDELVAAGL